MNSAKTIEIVDNMTTHGVMVPNVQIKTAGGNIVNLPITYEELNELDNASAPAKGE